MTDRSTAQIEREIEAERSALEHSIDALGQQFSPDVLVDKAATFARTHGDELASKALHTVRDNPAACALVGAGVAWLIASSNSRSAPREAPVTAASRPAPAPMSDFDARVAKADAALQSRAEDEITHSNLTDHSKEIEHMTHQTNWTTETDTASAQNLRATAASKAAALRARIQDGTAEMSEAARTRVVQARAAAVSAQQQVERQAEQAAQAARQTAYDRPLMIGALAMAAGAALALALPRTSTENRALGAQRDRLMDEADRIFREETSKLKSVASAAVAEGQAVAKDALSQQAPTPSGDEAVRRVTGKATSAASKNGVGQVS
ncbi:MAG: DUF3618 domain-containing protein [Pseudomonadota bacterium]